VLKACSGLNPSIVGKVERTRGQGLVGTIAARAEAMNLTDAPNHKKFMLVPDSGEVAFPVMLGVPIIAQRDVLGVI
jgi:phosphotransferase system enzyme I (PtsP)